MYEKLAFYYDRLGWRKYSSDCINIVSNILCDFNYIPEYFCDLACGTGEFIKLYDKSFDDVKIVGIDLSHEMINMAKDKLKYRKNIELRVGDMTNFTLNRKANLITCLYDSINHILTKEGWQDTFNSVYNNLDSDGLCVIDMIPLGGLHKWEGSYINTFKDASLFRKVKLYKKQMHIVSYINAFVKVGILGTYKNIKERCTETSFKLGEVLKMFRKSGFKKVYIYTEDGKRHKHFLGRFNEESRLYLVGRK